MVPRSSLLVGCSFSDYCGWNQVGCHSDPRCWYNLVANHYNITIDNQSYGGMSNLEILHKTMKNILTTHYDLVMIQLSSTQRRWWWRSNDPDQFLIYAGGRACNAQDDKEMNVVVYSGLELFNLKREVERDLTSLLMIQDYCQTHGSRLVIIDGLHFLPSAATHWPTLFSKINPTSLIGYPIPWLGQQIDFADDRLHPGVESNRAYAKQVITYLDKYF